MPTISGPQLATLVDEPFDREGWAFEIKWDGYRALGYHPPHEGISLVSRNGHSFDDRFPVIRDALETLPCTAIVDGEVVSLDEEGKSSFGQLQNAEDKNANLIYYLFDLLYVDGVDVRALSLRERKQLLQQLLVGCDKRLRYSDHVETSGLAFFEAAKQGGLEGIVAKDMAATYQTGSRTRHWLKIKIEQRQEFIIAGYTQPRRSRSDIGSLVLGYYGLKGKTAGKLRFAGHVGSGMDTRMRAELKQKLDARALKKSPFTEPVPTNEIATWVKPELVCEVRYTEKTADCQLRHPVFLGLRTDKSAKDIHWDLAQDTEVAVATAGKTQRARKALGRKKAASRKASVNARASNSEPQVSALGTRATNFTAAAKSARVNRHKVRTSKASASKSGTAVGKTKAKSSTRAKTKASTKASTKAKTKPKSKAKPKSRAKADANTKAQTKADTKAKTEADADTKARTEASVAPERIFGKEAPERDKLTLKPVGANVAISHSRRIYYPELKWKWHR